MNEPIQYVRGFLPADRQPDDLSLARTVQESIEVIEDHTGRLIADLAAENDEAMISAVLLLACATLDPCRAEKDARLSAALTLLAPHCIAKGGRTH